MSDALEEASVRWVVDLDDQTDHGRLTRAFVWWSNLTINAVPAFHGPATARVVIAPPEPAQPGECLRLPLADDQVERLIALLEQDSRVLDALAEE